MSAGPPLTPVRGELASSGSSPSDNLADLVNNLRGATLKVTRLAQDATENSDAVARVAASTSVITTAIVSTCGFRLKQQNVSELIVQQVNLLHGLIWWFGVNLLRDASLALGTGKSLVIFGWLKVDAASLPIRNVELYEEIFGTLHDLFQIGSGTARLVGEFESGRGSIGFDVYSDLKTLSWLASERSPLAMTVKLLAQSMSAMKGPGNAIPHLLLQIVLVIKRSLSQLANFSKLLRALQDRVCLTINALLALNEAFNTNNHSVLNTHMKDLILDLALVVIRLRVLEAVVAVNAVPHADSLTVILEAMLERTKNCERAIRVSQHSHGKFSPGTRQPSSITPKQALLVPSLPPLQTIVRGRDYLIDVAVRCLDDLRDKDTPTFQISKKALGGLRDLVALTGPTGIGKTTVALAVIHDQRVVDMYGAHRLFFSCEAFSDFYDLASALEGHLTGKTSQYPVGAVTNDLRSRGKALIVFDGLENDRFSADNPSFAVGSNLFASIKAIPGVVMIITARFLPATIITSGDIIHELQPLLPTTVRSSCRDIFADAAELVPTPIQYDAIDDLLRWADHLPLAAVLLGRCMRRGTSLSKLLESWSAVAFRLTPPPSEDTSSSSGDDAVPRAAVPSVAVAVALQILEAENSEAVKLLNMFSLLPDGVRPGILNRMREDRPGLLDRIRGDFRFNDFDKALASLKESRLVSEGADGQFTVLQAVRERADVSVPIRAMVRRIACDIAQSLAVTDSRLDVLPRRTPERLRFQELTNLRAMLTVDRGDVQAKVGADALLTLAGLCRDAPSTTPMLSGLFQSLQSEKRPQQNALLEGRCCEELGRCSASEGDWRTAAVWFERACSAYWRPKPPSVNLWASLLSLALCDVRRTPPDYDAAANSVLSALQGFQAASDASGIAQAHLHFGIVLTAQAEFDRAKEALTEAEEAFSQLELQDGVAACHQAMGELAAVSGDFRFSVIDLTANEDRTPEGQSGFDDDSIFIPETTRPRFVSMLTFQTDTVVGDRLSVSETVKAAYFQDDDTHSISTFNSHLL